MIPRNQNERKRLHVESPKEVRTANMLKHVSHICTDALGMTRKQNGSWDGLGFTIKNTMLLCTPGRQDSLLMWQNTGFVTEILEETGVHGWIITALLGEMKDLKEVASFESCETKFGRFRSPPGSP